MSNIVYGGQVTVEHVGGSYRIRFTHQGQRYTFGTGIKVSDETAKNAAIGLAKRVESDILSGRFQGVDPYKPQRRKKEVVIDLQSQFTEFLALKKAEVRTSTYTNKYQGYEKLVREVLGNAKAVEEFSENKAKARLLQWRSQYRYNSLKAIAQVLISFWDYLQPDIENKRNPWRKHLKGIKKDEVEKPEPFTEIERKAILRAIAENESLKQWLPLARFIMNTGCRPSEAFAVTYGDIDLSKRIVTISKGAVDRIVDKTKTGKSRQIPLTLELLECLTLPNNWISAKNDLLFPHPVNGGLINDQQFRAKWLQACKLAGVDYRRPYSNRHTWTTEAIAQGMHPVEAASLLGNSPAMIYKHYLNMQTLDPDKMPKI